MSKIVFLVDYSCHRFFLYPLKYWKPSLVCWCFQGVQKETSDIKWVDNNILDLCWSWLHTLYRWLPREIDRRIEESYEAVLRRKSKRFCEFWQNYQRKTLSVRFSWGVYSVVVVKIKFVLLQINLDFTEIP